MKTVGFRWVFTRSSQVVEGLQMIVPVMIQFMFKVTKTDGSKIQAIKEQIPVEVAEIDHILSDGNT